MSKDRQLKLGQREELKTLRRSLRLEINAIVQVTLDLFQVRDDQYLYTDEIKSADLIVYAQEISRKKKQLDKVNSQIKKLNDELGDEE